MEMALRVTEGLAAGFAARERVPLLDESIMAALLSLHRYLMQSLRLILILGDIIEGQYH